MKGLGYLMVCLVAGCSSAGISTASGKLSAIYTEPVFFKAEVKDQALAEKIIGTWSGKWFCPASPIPPTRWPDVYLPAKLVVKKEGNNFFIAYWLGKAQQLRVDEGWRYLLDVKITSEGVLFTFEDEYAFIRIKPMAFYPTKDALLEGRNFANPFREIKLSRIE